MDRDSGLRIDAVHATDEPLPSEVLGARVRDRMLAALPTTHEDPELARFYAHQRDYPNRGGKTLRGRTVVLSAAAHGAGDLGDAVTVAAALELFQAWVLVHDDIEDGSEERRGAPALHRLVGMPVALNVGDALHVHMWRLLHTLLATAEATPERTRTVRSVLDEFGAMVSNTAAGQHLDLSYVAAGRFDVSEEEYLRMVTLKTAWYTVASPLRLGALLAGERPDPRLGAAGLDLGGAFQVRDDVLNLAASADTPGYGKEALGDLYEAKRTLILAHLLANVSQDDRVDVTRRLSKPRAERSDEDVYRVLDLMRRHGSLEYAQAVADRLTERGLRTLGEALDEAPRPAWADALMDELSRVADRTR
ncbi:MAG TPA: polyprenyl synthetase family protein [Trueperaceae bacterium]|nr:polyprenyl synthetase family protein [Trueperaceae bacterium]